MNTDISFIELIETYIQSDKVTLPPFDRTALRIQQEIQKKDAKFGNIEKLIISDPAVASQVLKLANSAFFRGLSTVSTLKDAVVRLGLNEITRMVMILTQKKLYDTKIEFIRNYRNHLWQHALVCALVSQWVAKEAGFEELAQEVFFASLMHDIGKLFIITVVEKIKQANEMPFMPSSAVINEVISSQHAEQGYKLLKSWNLPETYCLVARDHHCEKFDKSNILLIILRLVNKVCNKVGISIGKSKDADMSAVSEASLLGFSEIKLAQLEIQIEDSLKRVSAHYKI